MQQSGFQLTAAGRNVRDVIAALDPDVTAPCSSQGQALTTARDDPDVAAPARPPKQLVCHHPDRSPDLRINGRPEISH